MNVQEMELRIKAKKGIIELLESDIRELRAALLVMREREAKERDRNR